MQETLAAVYLSGSENALAAYRETPNVRAKRAAEGGPLERPVMQKPNAGGKDNMKLWIDTEFNEYRGALISLALVAEDGREWYGVRYCDDPGWWVKEHVMPHLNQEPQRDATLRGSLGAFLCSFDSVHIVSDWPGDIAHLCNFLEWAPGERVGPDCMTFEVRRDLPDTSTTSRIPHNALEDARALARGALAAA